MTEPLVVCVMLKNGRDEMALRAARSFDQQTYRNRRLLIWDTGELNTDLEGKFEGVFHIPAEAYRDATIGALRNEANGFWTDYHIVCHWDSDDYSHPNRIAEQVELLQSSGAEAVGYSDMLFWRTAGMDCRCGLSEHGTGYRRDVVCPKHDLEGEAWLYTGGPHFPALGTSLMYHRRTWERVPFPDRINEREQNPRGVGEEKIWYRSVKVHAVSSLVDSNPMGHIFSREPRMIASIHGANTSGSYDLEELVKRGTKDWKRVPEWDAYCRKEMQL